MKRIIFFCLTVGGIFIFIISKTKLEPGKEDIIFFKKTRQPLGIEQETSNRKKYIFQLPTEKMQTIKLNETIDYNTLIREKIAPGTKGEFEIIIKAKQKVTYGIKFENKSQKPKNLKFYQKGKEKKYENLEEMEEELQGRIEEKEQKIVINWVWEYEGKNNKTKKIQKQEKK